MFPEAIIIEIGQASKNLHVNCAAAAAAYQASHSDSMRPVLII
jgi:hypothetical protein